MKKNNQSIIRWETGGKRAIYENIRDLFLAIECCIKNRYLRPTLILIYSGIDIMAWLNLPENQKDVKQEDFKDWINTYLIPNSDILCTADDIYSARCSILHSFTSESKKTREGNARMIFYSYGKKKAEELQEMLNTKSIDAVALNIDYFYEAFRKAVICFKRDLLNDSERAEIVYKRGDKFFMSLPPTYDDVKNSYKRKEKMTKEKLETILDEVKLTKAFDLIADATGDRTFTIISTSELLDNPEADGLVIFAGSYFKKNKIHDNLVKWIETEFLPALKKS